MDAINVGAVNGIAITAYRNDNGFFVPIRHICEALGIDHKAQRDKITEDEYLAPFGVLCPSKGADGRITDMFCLPLKFIFGWIFTINPKLVKPEARERVAKYRAECYDVLYRHFFGEFIEAESMSQRAREIKKAIEAKQSEAAEIEKKRKEINRELFSLGKDYDELTAKIINPEKHLFNS